MNQPSTPAPWGVSVKLSPATAGSLVLFVAFFLPWITLMGLNVAGFDLHKVWGPGRFVWTIPATALGATILGVMGRKNIALAQIAGGIPLVFFVVALYRYGGDLFSGLSFGGYLTLLSGIFLLCVAPRIGKKGDSAGAA